jgi:thiamine kinase
MDLGEPLASGRTAELHPWQDGRVLKLFHADVDPACVRQEAKNQRAAAASGLPVPEVGELVEIDGRLGLEQENVAGTSLSALLQAHPWAASRAARMLAQLHLEIHSRPAPRSLPSLAQHMERRLLAGDKLPDQLREAALRALRFLPSGNQFCHGDFHPGNVILRPSGAVIIGWSNATSGQPVADVARTGVLLSGYAATVPGRSRWQRWISRWMLRAYEARYFRQVPGQQLEYESWRPVVAAARVGEDVAELETFLLDVAASGLDSTSTAQPR